MPDYLQNLLEETENYLKRVKSSESYFQDGNFASTSTKSCIWFNGEPILPPLLSEEERNQIQEYRNAALKCEQEMYHRRRQKYTGEILQAKAVMERIQRKKSQKSQNASDLYVMREDDKRTVKFPLFDGEGGEWQTSFESWGSGRRTAEYNSSLRAAPDRVSTNLKPYEDSQPSIPQSHDNRIQDHNAYSTSQLEGRICRNPDESIASATSTASVVHVDNWVGHFSQFPSSDKSLQSVSMSMGESLHSQSTGSTVYEQTRTEVDSLASTSLSIAMTDASFTSGTDNFRSAQRQLNLASSDSPYNAYRQRITSSSTPKESPKHHVRQKLVQDQKQEARFHDLSLDSLEITRQKLLEEKQKQLTFLKQQELQRLRGLRTGADSSQHKHSLAPAGNMHGILDFSGTDQQQPANSNIKTDGGKNPLKSSSSPDTFESAEGHVFGSVSQKDLSREHEKSGVLEHDLRTELNGGQNGTLDLPKQYSLQTGVSPGSEDFRNMSVTDAVMEFPGEEFCGNTELDSASDKENWQAGSFHKDYPSKNSETRALVLAGRENLLSRNGGQDLTGERSKFALVSACAKGFLTRRLLKSDKVQALVKTVKDTKEFLGNISTEESHSLQDRSLQDRVEAQMKAARYSISDVFHKIPAHERMAYIAHSRNLARDRETKRLNKSAESRSKLSAATVRTMLRRHEGQVPDSVEQKKPLSTAHVKKTWNIRVLKPVQGNASPQRPDTARSKRQASRPTTAPERTLTEERNDKGVRPQTTETAAPSTNRGDNKPNKQAAFSSRRFTSTTAQPGNLQSKRSVRQTSNVPGNQGKGREVKRAVTHGGVAERPRTASLVKKSSRPVAAKFDHKLFK